MNRLRLRSEEGFTLIELLVVIAIIGILAAIAIPQFAAYRKRGYEATLKTDLRNLATAQEAYFAANQTYQANGNPPGYNQSADITSIVAGGISANGFTLSATHKNCTGVTATYTSTSGVVGTFTCP